MPTAAVLPILPDREPLLPTSTAPLHRMPKGLERRPPATLMAAARRIIADKERLLPARTVARQLTPRAPGIPRRPARMVVPPRTMREGAPSLRIPMARLRMVTLTTMGALMAPQ